MLTTLLTLGLLLAGEAHAADANVLVAPFTPLNKEAAGLSALLPSFLSQELDAHPELAAIPMNEVPPVYDMPARTYAETCPAREFVGCGFVLGETAGADFAVTGTVEALVTGTRVEVHIIDVPGARDVLSFQADLGTGDDEVFAQGVARVLVAVVRGEAGQQQDIREDEPEPEDPRDAAAISRQLDSLSREIGDVTTLSRRTDVKLDRPELTAADIAEEMEKEGSKPWERVGMSPSEYLRYKNSGKSVTEWRTLQQGRKGQLIVRPTVGYVVSGQHGEFYGRYAEDDALEVVETYAWQSAMSGPGLWAGGSVGYGIAPTVEVGLTGGIVQGRYDIDVSKITVGSAFQEQQPIEDGNTCIQVGGYVLAGLFPPSQLRPVVGAQVSMLRGTTVGSRIQLPSDLTGLPGMDTPPSLLIAGLLGGGELRVNDSLDAFAHVPLQLTAGGQASTQYQEGSGGLERRDAVPEAPSLTTGILVGVQVRFGGSDEETMAFDEYEGID